MILKRYQKTITQATAALEAVLKEELKLISPEKVKEVISTVEHPLKLEFKGERAFQDIAHFVYYKYDKPFLRYRFRLRGASFDWVIEKATDDIEADGKVAGILGLDGKPIKRK